MLKIGSVALLTQDTVRNTSSIKLHDLLLLLLRCLLIILLAMLLAQPQWAANKNKQAGWVLIDKTDVQQTYAHFKPQVDSLLNAGFEFHYFNNGFEEGNLQQAVTEKQDSAALQHISYWGLLSRLNKTSNTSKPIYLFTRNNINNFTGNRPGVALNVHWFTYGDTSTSSYIDNAYATQDDSICMVTANSSATGTVNSYNNLSLTQLKNEGYNIGAASNGLLLSHNANKVLVDTATLHITIVAGSNTTDAGYIKAAIDAIVQFSKRKITVTVENNIGRIQQQQDWLFWLSEQAIPAGLSAKNIFMYEGGTIKNIQSWVMETGVHAPQAEKVMLYKYIPAKMGEGSTQAIWQDGFGNALLQKQEGTANVYHFYSRLNPAWNDLPWSSAFPQMMFALLLNNQSTLYTTQANDKRMLDEKQLQPYFVKSNGAVKNNTAMATDVSPWFWLAAFIIFFMERIFALRTKNKTPNAR